MELNLGLWACRSVRLLDTWLLKRWRRHREKRVEDEKMRKVKTLGQAEPEVDDLAAWVSKSRALEEKARAEAREKALRQARALEQQARAFQGLLSLHACSCAWSEREAPLCPLPSALTLGEQRGRLHAAQCVHLFVSACCEARMLGLRRPQKPEQQTRRAG